MTTLAANARRVITPAATDTAHYPVIASDIVFEGAAVGLVVASGHARPLAATDIFGGFAELKADNSAGAAAAINVACRTHGRIRLAIGSLAITDIGKPVYASDDDTFTLTQGTSVYVGRVAEFISTGIGVVEFDARRGGLGKIVELVTSVGTGDGTVADVGASFNQTTLNNNFKDVADAINAILRQLA
jgi:hypothetical protein